MNFVKGVARRVGILVSLSIAIPILSDHRSMASLSSRWLAYFLIIVAADLIVWRPAPSEEDRDA